VNIKIVDRLKFPSLIHCVFTSKMDLTFIHGWHLTSVCRIKTLCHANPRGFLVVKGIGPSVLRLIERIFFSRRWSGLSGRRRNECSEGHSKCVCVLFFIYLAMRANRQGQISMLVSGVSAAKREKQLHNGSARAGRLQ
jgi:hypothetical protein